MREKTEALNFKESTRPRSLEDTLPIIRVISGRSNSILRDVCVCVCVCVCVKEREKKVQKGGKIPRGGGSLSVHRLSVKTMLGGFRTWLTGTSWLEARLNIDFS